MSTRLTPRTRALVSALAGVLLAAGLALLGPAPAATAVGPAVVSPAAGAVVGEVPTLQWHRVQGAQRYDVQVATSSGFASASLLVTVQTANSSFVPVVQLPAGQLWWRVRAADSGENGWTVASFTRAPVAGPVLGPVGDPGTPLQQPSNPPVVKWSAVAGAQSYTLHLSPDSSFTDQSLLRVYGVSATTYVVPDLLTPNTYFMRVRANLPGDLQSNWSSTGQFLLGTLAAAELVSPGFRQVVTDVAMDWKPVRGAVRYDVQLDDDQSFSPNSLVRSAQVLSTRYSPPRELANDDYFWRVRPVDANGNAGGWTVGEFTRAWPGQPTPVYPANGATVGNPFFFQWTPSEPVSSSQEDVSLASSYTLQISGSQTFQNIIASCTTTLTTYVPEAACMPSAAGTYYWRVLGTDDFSENGVGTVPVQAQAFRFSYAPDRVAPTAPHVGETVTTPTMSWQPVVGAARYRVTVINNGTGETLVQDTPATSFTPRTLLAPGTYRWQVQTLDNYGRQGSSYITGWPTFTVAAAPTPTASHPNPTSTPSGQRFPTLTWTPVTGAVRYEVWARPAEALGYTLLDDDFSYAAGEDLTDRFLVPGDYDFFVIPFSQTGPMAQGATGHFTILPLEDVPVDQQFAALTGTALPDDPSDATADVAADACSTEVLLADNQSECDNLRNTPVIRWATQPNAGYYLLYVAKDKDMTNGVYGNANGAARPITVHQPMWAPTAALPDSQANTAYYLRIVPCTYGQGCGALASAENSFDKLSRRVVLAPPRHGRLDGAASEVGQTVACDLGTNPADGQPIRFCANDVTLSWQDYRNSQVAPYLPTLDRPFDSDTPLQGPGQTEAASYVVEVATDPDFQNIFETAEVDQTTYTAAGQTFHEAPLYWRVRARDASGNLLPWSEPGRFVKKSPVPLPTSPAGSSPVPGDTPLSWTALDFAASYHVEVYKNGDTTASPANRVLDRITEQRVLTLDAPLPALAGTNDYVWRVQRIDASGRFGDWSSRGAGAGEGWARFTVARPAPQLTSPADGAADVPPSDALFSWQRVDGAVSYQWERLAQDGTTVLDAVRTPATAWAPQTPIPGGRWDWRVTAYDAAGSALGTSPTRTFTVVDTVAAVTALTITGSGRVGETLTRNGPGWNFSTGVTTTYQWLRDGNPIGGQDGLTYTVTDADRDRQLSVRATGTRDGYLTGTTTSNVIIGVLGNAPVATTAVTVSGSGKVGTTLTSSPPAWDSAGVDTTYQWQLDGLNIAGAEQSAYVVRPADVDKTITVVATGRRTGYGSGASVSGGVIGKLGDPASATTAVTISGPDTKTSTTWSLAPPAWDVGGVDTRYQWFRDATPIPGATGTTYRLTDADIGTSVTVHATGRRTGYQDGTSVSNAVAVTPLPALTATTTPSVSGVPGVRETLTAVPGTWSAPSGAAFTYQWFVAGEAVAKETGSSYVVRARDAGRPVSVRVSATADGFAPGAASSAPVQVALMKSTTTAATTTPKITRRQRAVVDVKVDLVDYSVDLGMVQVLDGKKAIAKQGLKTNGDGSLKIRLKKLKPGKHKITVLYLGNAGTQPSKAKSIKIVVTRR